MDILREGTQASMRAIKIYWSNGDTACTNINGTDEEIRDYYENNTFNIGNADRDLMVTCDRVEFLD